MPLEEAEAEVEVEVETGAEEVAGMAPAEAVDRAGIPAVAAVAGVDCTRTAVAGKVVAGKAVAGIADTPGEDNLVEGRAWVGPVPSFSWHALHLPPST